MKIDDVFEQIKKCCNEDVETINEFLFEKYVSNVKGGDKPE